MTKKYVIIHGHFYQPPRENAWLDQIEIQESAAPYHDWNEKITQECYGPNGVSRILNEEKQIVDIVNNYARMSFNFGPTLLSWLEQKSPKVYACILAADVLSQQLFGGHGSAIAQVYNHLIMPLATRADKETQVKWGIYDFEKRFGRKPKGMWLAETAVDTETLEVLAENEIDFTILAPNQCKAIRKIGAKDWANNLDTRRPYLCKLPSGKSIHLFFYDGDRSQGVAFKGFLNNGRFFAEQLLSGFDPKATETQLVHIATDGESYGHHHSNGDMALAYCTHYISQNNKAIITNYSQFLALEETTYEAQIHDNSSWSCIHGVERWRSNCGCETGGQPGWNQEWRVGLRHAIDWLRAAFDELFVEGIKPYHPDPWALRNNYISLFTDRSAENVVLFFEQNFGQQFDAGTTTHIIRMLEMQRNSLYMQTSCGWFFTELTGIETVQILQYANRGIQLAEEESDTKLEGAFLNILATAKSNLVEHGTGADIYKKWVSTKRLSLTQVGMHYAVSALFEEDSREITVLNYVCESLKLYRKEAGTYMLVTGATRVRSRVTGSKKFFHYAILYLGNHHIIGSTATQLTEEAFESIVAQIETSFERGNIAQCIDIIKWNFTDRSFSFFNLFRDEQLKLLALVTRDYEKNALTSYEQIYESSYSLLNFMRSENLLIPNMMKRNLETVFQYKLEELFAENGTRFTLTRFKRYAAEILKWNAHLDSERVLYFASKFLSQRISQFILAENHAQWFDEIYEILETLYSINLRPRINEMQDFVFTHIKENNLDLAVKPKVLRLAELLNLAVDVAPVVETEETKMLLEAKSNT